jgi:hypothetical protein
VVAIIVSVANGGWSNGTQHCNLTINSWNDQTELTHKRASKHTAADVVAKAQAVLLEAELLRAMFDVGYFPANTPPGGSTLTGKSPQRVHPT